MRKNGANGEKFGSEKRSSRNDQGRSPIAPPSTFPMLIEGWQQRRGEGEEIGAFGEVSEFPAELAVPGVTGAEIGRQMQELGGMNRISIVFSCNSVQWLLLFSFLSLSLSLLW